MCACAFTMIELLVALAIGAAVLTAGVIAFSSLGAGASPRGSYVNVTLDEGVLGSFYGIAGTSLDVWTAPNFGRRAAADRVKQQFLDDVARASAVFCLGRGDGVINTIHPVVIPVGAAFDGRALGLPDAFRVQLETSIPASVGVFTAYRGASLATNASIFILVPSGNREELSVLAVYDIDLITTASPVGMYASVRRYVGDTLTDFYDVFYDVASTTAFSPVIVAFERSARASVVEGEAIDRLKVAAQRPFYFVWWPDPAMPQLAAIGPESYASGDPRAAYANMGGQTSLFLVVPMFPAL